MTPQLLREIGDAYPGGTAALARWLAGRRGTNARSEWRSLQRYEAAERAIPDWLAPELAQALRDHRGALAGLLRRIPRT